MPEESDSNSSGSDRAVKSAIRLLSLIVAIMMFLMMAVTFTDVTLRYVFAAPIKGGAEFIEFIMGTLIFSALPIVSVSNDHISVSLFDSLFKGRIRQWQQIFISAVSGATVAFLSVRLFQTATEMWNDGLLGVDLEIRIAPVVFGMAFLSTVAFVMILVLIWHQILSVRTGRPLPAHYSSNIL